ncbi:MULTISPECIES: hypothetical protein, partial [Deefgea]|uniref:hypothetical protein n=1 Tax=Deefgea TaxID=400947 RepID=UPI0019448F3F
LRANKIHTKQQTFDNKELLFYEYFTSKLIVQRSQQTETAPTHPISPQLHSIAAIHPKQATQSKT